MSTTDESVSFSLEINVDRAVSEIQRTMTGVNRLLSILGKYIGDPTIDGAIRKLQDFLTIINQVRLALLALDVVTLASPSSWLLAGVSAVSAFVSVEQLILRPRP